MFWDKPRQMYILSTTSQTDVHPFYNNQVAGAEGDSVSTDRIAIKEHVTGTSLP